MGACAKRFKVAPDGGLAVSWTVEDSGKEGDHLLMRGF
jgi:hypothetical protein